MHPPNSSPIPAEIAVELVPPLERPHRDPPIVRILSSVWLAGCLLFGLQLFGAALVLRRRLSVCRPVTDAAVLSAAGNRLSTGRTQMASRVAGDAGIDQSLHRGDVEAQNHCAGIDRHGIIEHAAPARAGARTGASRARRFVDELAASPGADTPLVQSAWPGGRSGRCRPNAKRPATNWRSRRWARPIGLLTPPRSSSSRRVWLRPASPRR